MRVNPSFSVAMSLAVFDVLLFGVLSRFEDVPYGSLLIAFALGIVPLLTTVLVAGWHQRTQQFRLMFLWAFFAGLLLAEAAGIALRPALLDPSSAAIPQYSLRAVYPLVGAAHLVLLSALLVSLVQHSKRRSIFFVGVTSVCGFLYSLLFLGLLASEDAASGVMNLGLATAVVLLYLGVWGFLIFGKNYRSGKIVSTG